MAYNTSNTIRISGEILLEPEQGAFIQARREEMQRLIEDSRYSALNQQYFWNTQYFRGKQWLIRNEWDPYFGDPDLEMDIGL